MNKEAAQKRVDRITDFRAELQQLTEEDVLSLDDGQLVAVNAHHDRVIKRYADLYDVDLGASDKRLSMGMRLVSFFGAVAISAAVFFFFYRFWGYLGTTSQVFLLSAAPPLLLAAAVVAAKREKTLYFTSLLALVAFAAFVLNLSVLGEIFNITPSQNAFLVWGAFALSLAYAWGLRLLQVAGMVCLMGYLAATAGTWGGCYWISFGERPEHFVFAGLALAAVPLIPHKRHPQFAASYRVFGFLTVLIAQLILANYGRISYLPWPYEAIEWFYQIGGFVVSALLITVGIRRYWPGMVNLGSTFFTLFLYTKIYDWFWDWMPKYLFFLFVGLVAIGLLFAMRRVRTTARGGQR